MKRRGEKELRDLFNQCLERMGRGATVDECLADHPDHAEELRPLLLTANALQRGLQAQPREEARAAARERLRQAIRATPAPKRWRWPSLGIPLKVWAPSLAALVVFFAGFGVVQASGDALPGDTLYPVKRTAEKVRLNFPFRSDESKASYSEELARHRAEELAKLAIRRNDDHLGSLSKKIGRNVDRAVNISFVEVEEQQQRLAQLQEAARQRREAALAERHKAILAQLEQRLLEQRARLDRDLQVNLERLENALAGAPVDHQALLRKAIERLATPYRAAIQRLDAQLQRVRQGELPEQAPRPPEPPRQRPLQHPPAGPTPTLR